MLGQFCILTMFCIWNLQIKCFKYEYVERMAQWGRSGCEQATATVGKVVGWGRNPPNGTILPNFNQFDINVTLMHLRYNCVKCMHSAVFVNGGPPIMDVACTRSICIIWFFTRVAFLSAVQSYQVTFVKLLGSVFSSFPLLRHCQEWNGWQGYNLWQIWTSSGTSALYFPPIPSLEPSSTHTRETRTNK